MSAATETGRKATRPRGAPSAAATPGLEGVIVGETSISDVQGTVGQLTFRGYPAADLSRALTYEQVLGLLWEGEIPKPLEAAEIKRRLAAARDLPLEILALAPRLPKDALPMESLRTGVSLLGHGLSAFPPTREMLLPFVAQTPTWLAAVQRARLGLPPVAPVPSLGHVANYLYMLHGRFPEPSQARALEEYFVLLADHGMNASTFAARVVLATQSDPASALTAALGALKGPLHGGAPSLVADMLDAVATPENAREWIRAALGRKERLMGFGHRVYKTADPRAVRLKEIARGVVDPKRLALAEAVEVAGLEALRAARPEKPLFLNVEFYAALVLEAAGLPRELFTPTFGIARMAGYCAHLLEQGTNNRLIRPEVRYVGPPLRPVPGAGV